MTDGAAWRPSDPHHPLSYAITLAELAGKRKEPLHDLHARRPLPPLADHFARDYAADEIALLLRPVRDAIAQLRPPPAPRADGPFDPGSDPGWVQRALAYLRRFFAKLRSDLFGPRDVETSARKVAMRVSAFKLVQLQNDLEARLGTIPLIPGAAVESTIEAWVTANETLMAAVPERLVADIEGALVGNVPMTGLERALDLADLEGKVEKAERRLAVIAIDQVRQLAADVNQARLRAIGVRRFRWRTMRDPAVRRTHRRVEGKIFSFDSPPDLGNGPVFPGDEWGCRCGEDPVFE